MKKITKRIGVIFSILFAVSFNASALDDQIISTFETGATGEIGFSGYTVNYASSFATLPAVATNTLTTGINGSANCFSMTTATTAVRWKTLSTMTLASSITPAMITDRRYLKIMVRRDYNGNNLRILVNGTNSTYNVTPNYNSTPTSVWQDIVIDISSFATAGTAITHFMIEPVENNSSGLGITVTVALDNIVLSDNSTPRSPTITTSATNVYSHSTVYGAGPSPEKSFTVSGTTLLGDITLTPTVPYEISTTSGSGFTASALTLTPSSGALATTTIYTRLSAGQTVASYDTKNVVITTSGASAKNVALWGWVLKANQTITFDLLPTGKTMGDADFSPGATSPTSGVNAITYTTSDANVATIISGKIHIVGEGTCTINANQGLSANYFAATQVSKNITIGARPVIPISGNQTASVLTNPIADISVPANSELTIDATSTVHNITIERGGKVTLNNNVTLNINNLVINSDANGTGTFVDLSTVGQNITGTVQQYVTAGRNWYMSTPINSTASVSVLNRGASVQDYDEINGAWEVAIGTLTRGRGYIQAATAGQGTTGTVSFNGTINSGNVAVTLTNTPGKGKGFNLVGNPYPSYLSWSAVANNSINTNPTTGANMPTGTMWYRTIDANGKSAWVANTAYNAGDVVYNANRFYTATSSGTSDVAGGPSGTGTSIADNSVVWDYAGSMYVFATVSLDGTATPSTVSNLIPPMQAFWVRSNGGTLTFTNAMRTHETVSNRLKAPKNTVNEMPLVRLKVTNGVSADEAVIYASTFASNALDAYDAPKYFNTVGSNQPEIYTQVGNEKLVINALNELNQGAEIPLGFATERGSDFTISASELRNVGSDMQVLLKDKQTKTEFNLNDRKSYSFSSGIVNNADRFSLIFRTVATSTGLNSSEKLNTQVFVNATNQITIIAPLTCGYAIYNTVGQKQYENKLKSTKTTIDKAFPAGVYFVVLSVNGLSDIQKVIIR
jgi:hypothetical protein